MIPMTYKGYAARIEYSDEDECFVGHIAGITDIIGFHGETVGELRSAFQEAVDDYLATCAKAGMNPKKPYSGKIMVRVSPELHARVAMIASAQGKSLNALATEALENIAVK
ncbi:type II toxin-antitoxin system HicB family antitoxin [Solidesulfovibrio sp.]|uniref:type II toxin-antitoxin system HicB family antitoxin n=1 Tax=Solidesulfovibrio sp. TaxID=2910990 RepID=UPI00260CB0D1|nr:type II toxin-antitoxin system HicB family antitoxin [Solidesulfovibrio sp.]